VKKRIIVAAIFLPIVFIVLYYLPPYVLAGVLSFVCAVSAYELMHTVGGKCNERVRIYAIFSAALVPVGAYFELTVLIFPAVFLILMCLLFFEAFFAYGTIRKLTFSQILTALFAGTLIPLMLSSLVSLKIMPGGHLLVFLPFISAFLTDAGAYFTGLAFGKRKAFPLISPKKTVEGCIGGLVTGTAVMVVYGLVVYATSLHIVVFWALFLYGIIGAAITQVGDLAFSLVKREFSIKDYGRLLPGHGGMLDRFDSMVFTAPAMFLLTSLAPPIIPAIIVTA